MVRRAKSSEPATVVEPAPGTAVIPHITPLDTARVERKFWPKLVSSLVRLPFADHLLSLWYAARDPQTPAAAKGMMLAALAYFVMPLDAVPDMLAGIGFTDDAAVIAAVVATLSTHIRPRHREAARQALKRLGRGRRHAG